MLACLTGRIEFVTFGPVVHLPLLPTPPRGGAVAFDYARMHVRAAGTRTLLSVCAHGRTGARGLRGVLMRRMIGERYIDRKVGQASRLPVMERAEPSFSNESNESMDSGDSILSIRSTLSMPSTTPTSPHRRCCCRQCASIVVEMRGGSR